ncbi:SubName: Full=Uncharacterized protein {ECO:0000313/EMBL:CCA69547.1} [Serendipita indica DSM 11827]|uniref:Flavin reductase like domain-containing protein n=1 Tax=Serendipita indica (strain DSM 11827) TaxID=1109443 RepID=G4TE04_SERID|nr:SubName: Full=Uncharacterized protein {ECO:0000313/EMBL:CCA69547.1} [Serendipita indica DSM 11827]CCA69547.1 hypothetical protein PIIN_03486 [Serendipita indica DSM 11827]
MTRGHTTSTIQEDLRHLMVNAAQMVAIVTTRMPTQLFPDHPFHGATVSSFASIALHPHPLVSFSLRLPSRLADAIRRHDDSEMTHPHLVINLLSSQQATAALQFSRPDLFPNPFWSLPMADQPIRLTKEGVPYLGGSLGSISCSVVRSLPLDFSTSSENRDDPLTLQEAKPGDNERYTSELFLARVVRMEKHDDEGEPSRRLPLVYHQKRFTTVK